MNEVEIYAQLSNSMIGTGLFFIAWVFLLWVSGRAVTVALENNAGIVTKIATTIFGLVALYQVNFLASYVTFNFASAAHSLVVLKDSGADVSARALAFINQSGATSEVPALSMTPNLVTGLFIVSATYLILGRLWIGNK